MSSNATPQQPLYDFKGKNVFISGGSRGIGLDIALKLAKLGANVAIAAKTADPHPKLQGTIYTAAKAIDAAGGRGLPIICDIRFEDQVHAAVEKTVKEFGGIDILINNASAISLTPMTETPMKRFDLMNQINGRGTYLCTLACLPYLRQSAQKSRNPHVLTLSPPIDVRPFWFENHTAYSMAKFAMSLCTLGLSGEFRQYGIAVNALWPLTAIDTSAMNVILDESQKTNKYRAPSIMSDAAAVILSQDSRAYTGNFVIDEAILRQLGVTNFDVYKLDPKCPDLDLVPDFFIPEDIYAQARNGEIVKRDFVVKGILGLQKKAAKL
ncbi:UNVERIFIED_CONTAM: Hydroxysteroid dehydrogenase-like protein 2 [Siphonaria sp. JEL0065]|nr:Hydroxysteroid dehydrogenase-like protein 2 [Siphonaria sp. JEL0065]